MTIGPEPITRIFAMSFLRGIHLLRLLQHGCTGHTLDGPIYGRLIESPNVFVRILGLVDAVLLAAVNHVMWRNRSVAAGGEIRLAEPVCKLETRPGIDSRRRYRLHRHRSEEHTSELQSP